MNNLISVVIPCLNERAYIEHCVHSLYKMQSFEVELEVIVVDGGSTDGTLDIIKILQEQYSSLRLIKNPKKITPVALNLGIKNATADYILITSAHSSFEHDYISILKHRIEELDADVVGGMMLTQSLSKNSKSKSIVNVLSHPAGVGNSKFRTGTELETLVDTVPFGLYRKDLLEKAGGYNERLIRNHDMELSKRLISDFAAKIYLIPEAKCYYYARENYIELAKNNLQNGMWNMITIKTTSKLSSLSIRHFVPLAFVGVQLLLAIMGVFHLQLLILWLILIALYLISISYFSIKMRSSFIHNLWAFVTLHFSYGFGSIIGLFKSAPKAIHLV